MLAELEKQLEGTALAVARLQALLSKSGGEQNPKSTLLRNVQPSAALQVQQILVVPQEQSCE